MPSASVTAPLLTRAQSSSVFGSTSTIPFGPIVVLTALKTLSDAGSIRSAISSLTDTTGFISPQRAGNGADAAGAGTVSDVEQDEPRSVNAARPVTSVGLTRDRPATRSTSDTWGPDTSSSQLRGAPACPLRFPSTPLPSLHTSCPSRARAQTPSSRVASPPSDR